MSKQEAKSYLLRVLAGRGIQADFGIVEIAGEPWQVFEYQSRCIAIDSNLGIWIGPQGGEWKRIDICNVSSTLQAVDYLLSRVEWPPKPLF